MDDIGQAAKIMTEFKEHSQEEVAVPPTINHSLSSSSSPSPVDNKSSGYIMSRSHALPRQEEYKLEYWGRFEVPPPASGNTDQVVLIDTLVAKFREVPSSAGTTLTKFRTKKRSFGSRFMRSSTTKVSSAGLEETESPSANADSMESLSSDASPILPRDGRTDASPTLPRDGRSNSEGKDIPITFTAASPTLEEEGEEGDEPSPREPSTSPEDPADQHSLCMQTTNQTTHHSSCHELTTPTNTAEPNGRVRTVSSDFDTLPELANLKGSSEFQALSLGSTHGVQKVRLLFSGVSVVVYPQHSQQIILKKSIQNIACCAQVS